MKKLLLAIMLLATTACVKPSESPVNSAPSGVERSVAVISNEPMDLRICDRSCNVIVAFAPVWKQTGRGYEATIKFSTEYLSGTSFLKLIRKDDRGWSDWGSEEIRYLRGHDVSASDPACVGGTAWCATRGL